jgi:hypothetical protein
MKVDKDALVKHRFWVGLGAFTLLWLIILMVALFSAGSKAAENRPSFDGLAAQQAVCETPQAIAICASNDIVATDPGAEHDATGQSLEAPHRDGAAAGISARADLKRQPDKP